MLDLELPVLGVHRVQLALELEAQLHLLLMILGVLHVLLLQFEAEGALIGPLSLELPRVLLKHLHVLLEYALVVEEVLALGLEAILQALDLHLMLLRDI